jgi:hypothetical protein
MHYDHQMTSQDGINQRTSPTVATFNKPSNHLFFKTLHQFLDASGLLQIWTKTLDRHLQQRCPNFYVRDPKAANGM